MAMVVGRIVIIVDEIPTVGVICIAITVIIYIIAGNLILIGPYSRYYVWMHHTQSRIGNGDNHVGIAGLDVPSQFHIDVSILYHTPDSSHCTVIVQSPLA